MAGVYVRSNVSSEACFLPICYKNYFCSIKYIKVTPLQHGLLCGGDARTSAEC